MAMMGQGPWAPAQEDFNKFARMDHHLAATLNDLSAHQARESKLASAYEEGRIYGLRQQRYNMILKRQLNKDLRHPPVEHMW